MLLEFDGTIIIAIFSFVLFVFVMNKIFYEPLLSIIEKRESYIDENSSEIESMKEKIDNMDKERSSRLLQAKRSIREKLHEMVESLKLQKNQELRNTTVVLKEENDKSKKLLDEQKKIAKDALASEVSSFSRMILNKVINKKTEGDL